jgi:hypothetical protein
MRIFLCINLLVNAPFSRDRMPHNRIHMNGFQTQLLPSEFSFSATPLRF